MKNLLVLSLLALVPSISFANLVEVDTTSSVVRWKGEKVTGKHEGTIKVKSGSFDIAKGTGTIVIDMTSINVTDIKDAKNRKKLMGHLRAKDFFDTENFKTATLTLKKARMQKGGFYAVDGELKIKGETHPTKFTLTQAGKKYTGKLVFDRTKYGIRYKSKNFFENLGDKVIYDDVKLTFELQGKTVSK